MGAKEAGSDVVMFMSADVVGSTSYKVQAQRDRSDWLEAFASLFRELPLVFMGQVATAFIEHDDVPESGVWKVMGDEVILLALPTSVEMAEGLTAAFCNTVRQCDARISARWPLNLRGTCWAASVGQRNRRIEIPEMFGGRDGSPYVDFLGPDVDTGFRLSAHSGHGEVIVSPNLLESLARQGDGTLRFHHAGSATLKGVIQGQPFPLWIASADGASPRPATPAAEVARQLAAFRSGLLEEHGVECADPVFGAG
jgi:class 3 adenylate cyclase